MLPIDGVLTRAVDLRKDIDTLRRLDTSVESDRIFRIEDSRGGLHLTSVKLAAPIEKRFPLTLGADSWTDGWVIEENGHLRGFIACGYSGWNKRILIWHFYVDQPQRRRGFGRQLMDCALSRGREWGARTAWAETSNVNYPGVVAYQRLGFQICGFDTTLYRGTANEAEFGLFLARHL